MLPAPVEKDTGSRLIFMAAACVVIVMGLRLGATVLLPLVLASFLAILSLPLMLFLLKRGVPRWLATLLTVLAVMAVVTAFIFLAGMSASELQRTIGPQSAALDSSAAGVGQFSDPVSGNAAGEPTADGQVREPAETDLVARLVERRDQAVDWIANVQEEWNLPFAPVDAEAAIRDLVNPIWIVDFVSGAVGRAAQVVATAFVVFLVMAFMLIEATVLPDKLRLAFGVAPGEGYRPVHIVKEIRTYLAIKSGASATTGLLIGVFTHVMGLDFPILLGVTAFLLNYVPTVGSIVAAIPAVVLSLLLDGSLGHLVAVAAGYVFVNTLIGNIVEPNLMGRSLGISTLAVVLSLLFWGWVWGPLGALLSVPLTAVVKIWLENTPDLNWAAILLGKGAYPPESTPIELPPPNAAPAAPETAAP